MERRWDVYSYISYHHSLDTGSRPPSNIEQSLFQLIRTVYQVFQNRLKHLYKRMTIPKITKFRITSQTQISLVIFL